ncbi:hypothetical protein EU545_02760 [Candidatus Thorarchaeota archaeon]|nr:MAG: hypothetical protein EU545_02760 [Candidatus Thorarchaeota archaeon]
MEKKHFSSVIAMMVLLIPCAFLLESVAAANLGRLSVPGNTSGYGVASDAADSMLQVVTVSGLIALIVVVIVLVLSRGLHIVENRFLRRKPLLVFAMVFMISAVIVGTLAPLPISDYHGPNTRSFSLFEPTNESFVMYEPELYRGWVDITAEVTLEANERVDVDVHVLDESGIVENTTIILNSSTSKVTRTVSAAAGQYQMAFDFVVYQDGEIIETEKYISITISQPVAEGHLEELVEWDTYRFLVGGVIFTLILVGMYGDMLLKSDEPPEAPY